MQPINYLLENKNPVDVLMGSIGQWQTMRNNDIALQEQQAKADYTKNGLAGLQNLDFNDINAVRQYASRYPELAKGVTSYLNQLDEKERQGMLADMSKSISLLRSGDSANAAKLARDKATAYRNAGNTAKADEYEQVASMMETHPTAALQSLSMSYAIALPKDAMGNYKDMLEANAPTVKELDSGDKVGGYVIDPVTGEVKYQKFTDKGIDPTKQADYDNQFAMNQSDNQTKKEIQIIDTDGKIKTAQIDAQGRIAVANAQGQWEYQKADLTSGRTLQGVQIDAQSRERVSQAELEFKYQQQNAVEYRSYGGKVYYTDKQGHIYEAKDAQGNPILDPKQIAGSPAVKQQEEAQRTQRVDTVLNDIEKLLPQATGSWVGTGVDKAAGFFGKSTDGATATAQLQSLSGQLVALMPKMSGPQSDKDVLMYKQMAGQLDDSTKPIAQRMAALQTIRALNRKYASMNAGQPVATSKPTNAGAATGNTSYLANKYQ